MRHLLLTGIALGAIAVAACDQRRIPTVAGIGTPSGDGSSTPTTNTPALSIIPTRVQLAIGGSFQLSTNAPSALVSQLQWRSTAPAVVAVNPSGLVTALTTGTAVIVARYSFDTTSVATATIVVTGP